MYRVLSFILGKRTFSSHFFSQVMIVRSVCFIFSSIYTIVLLLWDFWILAAMIDVLLLVLSAVLPTSYLGNITLKLS